MTVRGEAIFCFAQQILVYLIKGTGRDRGMLGHVIWFAPECICETWKKLQAGLSSFKIRGWIQFLATELRPPSQWHTKTDRQTICIGFRYAQLDISIFSVRAAQIQLKCRAALASSRDHQIDCLTQRCQEWYVVIKWTPGWIVPLLLAHPLPAEPL